mmetsp:Transcript_7189/g.13633  ORF Transcript_7189/g.13633 Transcript_7189/m.13633 type:complete len:653 (+) Transcript_7189:90-2048(+)
MPALSRGITSMARRVPALISRTTMASEIRRGVFGGDWHLAMSSVVARNRGKRDGAHGRLSYSLGYSSVADALDHASGSGTVNIGLRLTDLLANNKPREAVALFDKWKNGQVAGAPEFVPSLQSYNLYLLASARVVNSRLQTLLAAIIEMRSRGIEPNAMSYNALLRHCARHNAAHDAVAIMKEMNDKGIHPNATSYTNAITAMIAGGLGRQALDQLELMRKAGFTSMGQTTVSGRAEVRQVYCDLVALLMRRRRFPQLRTILQHMHEDGYTVDGRLAVAILEAGLKENDVAIVRDSVKLLPRAASLKSEMHIPESKIVRTLRMAALKKDAQLADDAWELTRWASQPEQALSPGAYHALIDACVQTGQTKKALTSMSALFKAHPDADKSVLAFPNVVEALSERVEAVDEAYFMLVGMLEAGEDVCVPAVNVVVAACARVGDLGRAFETFLELQRTFKLEPTTQVYNTLMRACSSHGQGELVPQLLQEMESKGLTADCETHCAVMDALVSVGNMDEALEKFKWMKEGLPEGQAPAKESVSRLIRGLLRWRRTDDLKRVRHLAGWFGYHDLKSGGHLSWLKKSIIKYRDNETAKYEELQSAASQEDQHTQPVGKVHSSDTDSGRSAADEGLGEPEEPSNVISESGDTPMAAKVSA